MILDRTPECRIGRVVDDDDAFKIRIFEARDRIERGLEHFRRLAMGRNMDRNLRRKPIRRRHRGHRNQESARTAPESDLGDFFDTRERDHDQRNQENDAEPESESGAEHEIVALPERENGREPSADDVDRHRERCGFDRRGAGSGQERQRQQQPEQDRKTAELPMVGITHYSRPCEFGLARGIEHAPIHADAAFVGLPGLIECLDDVVIDAVSVRPRDEVAQYRGLLDPAGNCLEHVVAAARPAELGDDDALAGMGATQLVVEFDRPVDRLAGGEAIPIGQDVSGDEIDRRGKLRMVDPDRPYFAGRDRHRTLALDPLDEANELVDRLLRAQGRLVAHDDGVDVAVAACQRNAGLDFPLVAGFVLVDPDAERDLEPELCGNRRHQLAARGRAIGADGVSVRTENFQIRADLLRCGAIAVIGMLSSRVGRI